MQVMGYQPTENYGVIGDVRTAALSDVPQALTHLGLIGVASYFDRQHTSARGACR